MKHKSYAKYDYINGVIFIRYYKDLIVEDNIDIIKAKELFSQGISLFNVYAICVSSKTNGLMEIMSTENLLKKVNSYEIMV